LLLTHNVIKWSEKMIETRIEIFIYFIHFIWCKTYPKFWSIKSTNCTPNFFETSYQYF